MLFRNISYLFRNKSKTNWYIAESLYISDHKIGKYAEKPQDKRDSPRIWRTIYVSYRTGQRYNVRKRLLFIGNVPPGIFWNQIHTKKENCGAKILNSFPIWKKAWEDIMLEKIMDLQILLYSMAALGTLGAIGMLTTNLTYRRMLKSTGSKNTGTKNTQGAGSSQRISLKEKWLRLWKTRDRLLHRMNRLVWYPALLSTVILGCAIYFSKTLRIVEDRKSVV